MRRSIVVLLALAAALPVLPACAEDTSTDDADDDASEAAFTGVRPTLTARAVDDARITIDGIVDDSWKEATPVTFDTDWSGAKTGISSRVRARWSKTALYMLWELDGAAMNVDASRPLGVERENLFQEDCVEMFLGTSAAEPTRYFELETGPLGHFFDLAIDRKKKTSDAAWFSHLQIATRVDQPTKHVTIEVAFRAPEIVAALVTGAKLPLALYRMEGKAPARRFLAWSPTRTPKPNFHVPDAFGKLNLVK